MVDEGVRIPALVLRFRRAIIIAFQLTVVVVANLVAFHLRFDNGVPPWAAIVWWQALPWLVAIRAITFIPFPLYEGFLRYSSLHDLRALVSAVSHNMILFFRFVTI